MMDRLRPRLATVADAEEINAIYNYYVRTSAATFQVDDETTEERVEELRTRPGNQPPFRSRCAYRDTIELTVYVRPDCHRQGFGRVMVQDLIERARSSGFHTVLAVCCEESVGMIRMLDSLGFKLAGRFREVGIKFGRRLDVVYLQLLL